MELGRGRTPRGAMARSRCKLVFVGDFGVGKTSIINRFLHGSFDCVYRSTIGVDFAAKTVTLGSSAPVRLHLWDTAGQEKFRSLASMYIRDAAGVMVVYDVTSRDSFLSVPKWIGDIRAAHGDGPCIFLVGNKTDLSAEAEVSPEEGEEAARLSGAEFVRVSAKAGSNIEALFQQVAARVSGQGAAGRSSFKLDGERGPRARAGGACGRC
mmetsp:Transcript_18403/g.52149  ORF Transcript_18403/g.52149 Transcript_18403/m.52149 type:complete len:210 (+) Transcript_18403:33-662(+)